MNLYYFGDSANALLGIYHPPRAQQIKNHGVLLCYPIGHEYIRSHRAFNQLANQLSKAGLHVFRFDYLATGDSSGKLQDGTTEKWLASIKLAIEELQATSGVAQISLVGLRLGASLAALHCQTFACNHLVLWDPVIRGTDYLSELKVLHRKVLNNLDRFRNPRKPTNTNDMIGFPYLQPMRDSINSIILTDLDKLRAKTIHLVVSEQRQDYSEYFALLGSQKIDVDYRLIPGAGDWDAVEKIDDALTPFEILKSITEQLSS
jgi:esterase/lipase